MKLPPSLVVLDAAIQQWTSDYQCCYGPRNQPGHTPGCPLIALQQLRDELVALRATTDGHQCWFVCQGCGVLAPGKRGALGGWQKPAEWYERGDAAGAQTACSIPCIDVIAAKTGKSNVVLPL